MKSKYNITEVGFTAVVQAAKRHTPPDNLMCENHYEVKKLMSAFGLPYQKIDTCLKGCMLFWKENANLEIVIFVIKRDTNQEKRRERKFRTSICITYSSLQGFKDYMHLL